ncbi:hypothetical protein [Amycolatopsis sp. NPDC051371]|uniref:hypothetical protein n=1 Tax=Amycolatopsis sp. NPDC051371 TaxID=3155800 RepID=UPI003417C443
MGKARSHRLRAYTRAFDLRYLHTPAATKLRAASKPCKLPAHVPLLRIGATAVPYFWNLTASGYGNSFYAAAVQSGTQDWKAWLADLDPDLIAASRVPHVAAAPRAPP